MRFCLYNAFVLNLQRKDTKKLSQAYRFTSNVVCTAVHSGKFCFVKLSSTLLEALHRRNVFNKCTY